MKLADCKGCEKAVWAGRNLKCNATGEPVYIHLVNCCPQKKQEEEEDGAGKGAR